MGGKTAGGAAPAVQPADKKKRNTNPGVRQQGGRIYDSENGTTCHQCRQKTIEVKAKCNSCTLFFCPRCLENRYSEVVEEANAQPGWACPRCRKLCNCSNCRKKAGLDATGQLASVAKCAGFGSVCDLLAQNPNAQALALMQKRAAPNGSPPHAKTPRQRPAPRATRKPTSTDIDLQDDWQLGPRPAPMPRPHPLALHLPASSGGGGKRQRGPVWLEKLPPHSPLPAGVDPSQLTCVLEFLAVFGGPALGLRSLSLAGLAAELVQPPALRRADQLCPVPEDSLVAAVHTCLLEVVRDGWGVPGQVTLPMWQPLMQPYFAAEGLPPAALRSLREQHGGHQHPAVAGELVVRPKGSDTEGEHEGGDGGGGGRGTRGGVGAAAQAVAYPEGGYWGLGPGVRVSMLYALVHDALDVHTVRQVIERGMGGAAEADKERCSELAEVRRAAKEAAALHRDREIALIVAGEAGKALSLEEQRKVVGEAKERAEAAAREASAAKVRALEGAVHPVTVRVVPLGQDRDGRLLFKLQAAGVVAAGGEAAGVVVLTGSDVAPQPAQALPDVAAVARALDGRGRAEGPLRHALVRAFKLSEAALQLPTGHGEGEGGAAAAGVEGKKSSAGKQTVGGGARKRRPSEVLTEAAPALPPTAKRARVQSVVPPKVEGAKAAKAVRRRGLAAASPE